MVEAPLDPPRDAAVAANPYIVPVLRHGGWFGFFLVLAPAVGPRGYGLFMLALSGIAIVGAVLAETGALALENVPGLDERHWSTALVTMMAAGTAVSLAVYVAAGPIGGLIDAETGGDLFRSLSMLPLLDALAVVPGTALRRERRYAAPTAAAMAGLAAGGGVAVALAEAGAGPWSLAAQIVVQRLVECTVLWAIPGERIGLVWSRRHFAESFGTLRWPALVDVCPVVASHATNLVVGLVLGPSACGLYLLAGRLGEAVGDIARAGDAGPSPREAMRRACRVALPAVLSSGLLAIAMPAILDLLWWGAVLPAQILLLGAVPSAIVFVRAACEESAPAGWRWRTAQALGGVAVTALAAPYGLETIAAATLGWTAVAALAGFWTVGRNVTIDWRAALAESARPCGGAVAAALLLFVLAQPVGLALPPVPALCLLTASGWLLYVIIRGAPIGAAPAVAAG